MKNEQIQSLNRCEELRLLNHDFFNAKKDIIMGSDVAVRKQYLENKNILLSLFHASEQEWNDWHWQMQHRVNDVNVLSQIVRLDDAGKNEIERVGKVFRWGITPYYLALISPLDPRDPIRLLSLPSEEELSQTGTCDPMCEEYTNPAAAITRRYPDRLIINVTNSCASICRHCQRKRLIQECDYQLDSEKLQESIQYISENSEIRDVLITGGDPLTLSNEFIDKILFSLHQISHVEMIRIGSRVPVTMPQRIDNDLLNTLKKYKPLYINTQFNHPKELTQEAIHACNFLADNGIILGNQMVLLNEINNNKYVVRLMNQELLKARVRPYYMFHAKDVRGTTHFQTSIDDGLEIMKYLRGNTSGLAIPTYILNAPGGLGKIPILPDYLVSRNNEFMELRTWEDKKVCIRNHLDI